MMTPNYLRNESLHFTSLDIIQKICADICDEGNSIQCAYNIPILTFLFNYYIPIILFEIDVLIFK